MQETARGDARHRLGRRSNQAPRHEAPTLHVFARWSPPSRARAANRPSKADERCAAVACTGSDRRGSARSRRSKNHTTTQRGQAADLRFVSPFAVQAGPAGTANADDDRPARGWWWQPSRMSMRRRPAAQLSQIAFWGLGGPFLDFPRHGKLETTCFVHLGITLCMNGIRAPRRFRTWGGFGSGSVARPA